MDYRTTHLTRASIDLDHLRHNMELLQSLAGSRPLYPAIKANAYGHDAEIIGRELIRLGYATLCTAHVGEAAELIEKGLKASFIILSPTLAENSSVIVDYGLEPVVCSKEQIKSLADEADRRGKQITIHIKVDTGMGRVGVAPAALPALLDFCQQYRTITVASVCTHFPMADADDLEFSHRQITQLREMQQQCARYEVPRFHCANSAAIFALPDALFDAARPGISIYGLRPNVAMQAPRLDELKPVLSLTSRITHLQQHDPGSGISYGHTWHTKRPAMIATIPCGYGDGISRILSNQMRVLIRGKSCAQVGNICMDQLMIDVTAIADEVARGDEVVIIGSQGSESISADELAQTIGTINYEVVTALSARVPRIVV